MMFDELNGDYMLMCDKHGHCSECKYFGNYPCQLAYGYDKGRADAIDECIKVIDSVEFIESDYYIEKLQLLKGYNK